MFTTSDFAALLPGNHRNGVFRIRIVSKLLAHPWGKNLQGLSDFLVEEDRVTYSDPSAYNARNMQSSQLYSSWLLLYDRDRLTKLGRHRLVMNHIPAEEKALTTWCSKGSIHLPEKITQKNSCWLSSNTYEGTLSRRYPWKGYMTPLNNPWCEFHCCTIVRSKMSVCWSLQGYIDETSEDSWQRCSSS